MRIKYGEILNAMEPEEVYTLILNGNINKFPNHYWKGEVGKERAAKCIKHLVEKVLCWSDEEVLQNFRYETFHNHKLKTMVQVCFNDCHHKALNYAYPEKFQIWRFKTSPRNFYTKENTLNALRWEIQNNLKCSRKTIKTTISDKLMKELKLYRGYQKHFKCSPYNILNELHEYKFKATELKKVPKGYWSIERTIDEIVDVTEKKDYTVKELMNSWSRKFVEDNRLMTPIDYFFKGNYIKALELTYPNIYENINTNPNAKLKDLYKI